MSEQCHECGAESLVVVMLPGHDDVEAIVSLACGRVQPVAAAHKSSDP